MKQQVARLSPHQNGKVFAVLMALGSLLFLVPFGLIVMAMSPAASRPSVSAMLAMPILYLVFGYVSVAIGCAVYNLMFRWIGGFEFEATSGGD